MGFNTTIVVSNDTLDAIAEDKNFGKKLVQAILRVDNKPISVSAVSKNIIHCNAAEVVETHHADQFVAVAVGCNSGEMLGYVGHYDILNKNKTEEARKLEMIRLLALNLGYTLHKKPKRS